MSTWLAPDIEDRLGIARPGIREKLRDFLDALKAADPEIQITLGNAGWNAVDAFKSGRHFARVFLQELGCLGGGT